MFKIRIFFADRFDRLVHRSWDCVTEELILKYTEVTRNYKKKTLYIQYVICIYRPDRVFLFRNLSGSRYLRLCFVLMRIIKFSAYFACLPVWYFACLLIFTVLVFTVRLTIMSDCTVACWANYLNASIWLFSSCNSSSSSLLINLKLLFC